MSLSSLDAAATASSERALRTALLGQPRSCTSRSWRSSTPDLPSMRTTAGTLSAPASPLTRVASQSTSQPMPEDVSTTSTSSTWGRPLSGLVAAARATVEPSRENMTP